MTAAADPAFVRREDERPMAPPRSEVGLTGWVRKNLFSSIPNTILTLVGIALVIWIVPSLIRWAFIDAVWTGSDREACLASDGACWAFVKARFGQFMYGRYPIDERWRVDLTGILLLVGLVPMAIPRVPFKRENGFYLIVVFPIVALILLTGGHFSLSREFIGAVVVVGCLVTGLIAWGATHESEPVLGGIIAPVAVVVAILAFVGAFILVRAVPTLAEWTVATAATATLLSAAIALIAGTAAILLVRGHPGGRHATAMWIGIGAFVLLMLVLSANFGLAPVETPLWGGLLVTLVVAIVGIVTSLPLGILLALGRRSRMPFVRVVSVAFIEFIRGVPLITVLFMASVMLPVFLPPGVTFDKLLRALIGVALFSAAYMAEVIRGGLQAIPRGQHEAAQAMGLTYWQTMRLIILPQALRIVIPGIVNSFISLFKDTSLVLIIGIFDLLGIVQLGFSDANWAAPTVPATGYVFAALVFWGFCFGMSRYSMHMERRLGVGRRR